MANITLTLEEYQDILDRLETIEEKMFKEEDEFEQEEKEEEQSFSENLI